MQSPLLSRELYNLLSLLQRAPISLLSPPAELCGWAEKEEKEEEEEEEEEEK